MLRKFVKEMNAQLAGQGSGSRINFNTSELMRIPPPPLPPRIGSYIRILPVLQASLCLLPSIPTGLHKTPASFLAAIALLTCVPLHAWLGKKFYAS